MKLFLELFKKIIDLLGEDRNKLVWLVILFLLSSSMDVIGLSLIGPYISLVSNPNTDLNEFLLKLITFFGLSSDTNDLLLSLGVILISGFFLKVVITIYVNYQIFKFSQKQQVRLRCYLMQGYQQLSYVDYISRNSSEYINNMQSLAARFAHKIIMSLLRILSEGTVLIAILIVLAWNNPVALTLMLVLIAGFLLLYYFFFRNRLNQYGKRYNEASRSMLQSIQEGFDGFKEIRILDKTNYFLEAVRDAASEFARTFARSQIIGVSPRYIVEFLSVVFVVILIVASQWVMREPEYLIPTLAMFGLAAMRLVPIGNIITGSFITLRFNSDTVHRLHADWVNLKKETQNSENVYEKQGNNIRFEELKIDNIRFSYPNAKINALDGISMNIKAGESIGFIGPSGCGKTTLVDALLGLLKPKHGQISYNGKSFTESLVDWRRNVAYLPQQIFLIDNTLSRNIALGIEDANINKSKVHTAIRQARLGDLCDNLPEGIDTMLGERGVRLSGGQRQRIALARAFYHEREVLVMDESTSALDVETEKEIVNEIKRLKGKKTVIVIAHRLATLQYCDRIYRLKSGRIVESGTYENITNENSKQ